ncbi:MAG: transcriptional regulator [Alphaproteobacteria bacterium]|nr:MAG: transcriptional regulator [Alphaproteobacteria bacterium]
MKHETPSPVAGLEEAAQAFAALGSEQRLLVLRTLVRAGPEGLAAGALARRTGIAASTLTHHLRFLTQAGLVTQERRGRSVICAAAEFATVERLAGFLIEECCADRPADRPAVPGHVHSERKADAP